MATYTKYEHYIEAVINTEVDAFGPTQTLKYAIHSDAPVVATDDELADLTQIAGSNGYTTGGDDSTNDSTRSGGTVTTTGTDIVWTASGGNLGASTIGRYFSGQWEETTTDILQNYWDYGATFTVANGETMTLDFGASINTYA